MAARAEALIAIVERDRPCTVRGVFYQATVQGLVAKSEAGYVQVQRQLADLRRAGRIPFAAIVDNTRWRRQPLSFDSVAEALAHTRASYRKRCGPVWTLTSKSGWRRTR